MSSKKRTRGADDVPPQDRANAALLVLLGPADDVSALRRQQCCDIVAEYAVHASEPGSAHLYNAVIFPADTTWLPVALERDPGAVYDRAGPHTARVIALVHRLTYPHHHAADLFFERIPGPSSTAQATAARVARERTRSLWAPCPPASVEYPRALDGVAALVSRGVHDHLVSCGGDCVIVQRRFDRVLASAGDSTSVHTPFPEDVARLLDALVARNRHKPLFVATTIDGVFTPGGQYYLGPDGSLVDLTSCLQCPCMYMD